MGGEVGVWWWYMWCYETSCESKGDNQSIETASRTWLRRPFGVNEASTASPLYLTLLQKPGSYKILSDIGDCIDDH